MAISLNKKWQMACNPVGYTFAQFAKEYNLTYPQNNKRNASGSQRVGAQVISDAIVTDAQENAIINFVAEPSQSQTPIISIDSGVTSSNPKDQYIPPRTISGSSTTNGPVKDVIIEQDDAFVPMHATDMQSDDQGVFMQTTTSQTGASFSGGGGGGGISAGPSDKADEENMEKCSCTKNCIIAGLLGAACGAVIYYLYKRNS